MMEERRQSLDSVHSRKSDSDKSSNNSYYSDDDSSRVSDHSQTISTQSTHIGNRNNKIQNLKSHVDYHATKQFASKYAPSKRGIRWGFHSQSLNRESPSKDISLVTKRVLSARLLKINELRNELTELHVKLDELHKENRALKQLQYRHEKALRKFEDTENEISQLLSRHNEEMRILKERLRKSQEKEHVTEKKLRVSEEELSKAKCSLQKLKKLAEDKHLPEREELAKKLSVAENRLDDSEKRIKDFEKKLELSNNSFQRQMHSEKKKLCEAQEDNKFIQEEVQRLKQKLKEKEKELGAKNIYANRMLKHSPQKQADSTPRKKEIDKNATREAQNSKGVQTAEYCSPIEFPSPPDFISNEMPEKKEDDGHLQLEQIVKDWKEKAEHFKQEQNREKEARLKNEQELQALEERAKKLRDEWEKEENDRRKESSFFQEKEEIKLETEIYTSENETQDHFRIEEERQKEILLAKMYEIDLEIQSNIKTASQELATDTAPKSKTLHQLSETIEKLPNGLPERDQFTTVTQEELQKQHPTETSCSSSDLTFGSYVPSFGKGSGRPSWHNQKIDFLDELTKENVGLETKKERKPNLMEQLFGSSVNTIIPLKRNDFQQESSTNGGSQATGTPVTVKDDTDLFFSEGKSFNPKRHRVQHTANRPAVKPLEYLEDEIEEVLLQ